MGVDLTESPGSFRFPQCHIEHSHSTIIKIQDVHIDTMPFIELPHFFPRIPLPVRGFVESHTFSFVVCLLILISFFRLFYYSATIVLTIPILKSSVFFIIK